MKTETSRLKPLSVLYMQFTARHRGQPPPDEEALKRFIQAEGREMLDAVDGDVDRLFISERDDQPFVVHYGGGAVGMQQIIAHEQQGVDGKRLAAGTMGNVMFLDESDLPPVPAGAK